MSIFSTIKDALFHGDRLSAEQHFQRGLAEFGSGHYPAALRHWNRVIEIEPQHGLAYYNRGVLQWFMNHHDIAVEDLLTALHIFTEQGNQEFILHTKERLREMGLHQY